ncbi:N-acetylmuramoyl-L-alanine amidase [Telmatobacter sp. DSM 110680]|uniref:N-acetylmuramoyl-L-alanine amidase n=1 Tax=Telmatobacter sp. DSM 110680 TaxID=3036704 RepID=A0AAU7DSY8_9BACT
MPWSKVLKRWVPQVWSFRPWWDFPPALSLLIVLAFLPCAAQQPPSSPAPTPPPPPAPRFVVVLDAAHGGDDTGAHLDSGQLEKNVNLVLNIRLRSLLSARGIQVITTRESDVSVDLTRRAELANHANAAACLSLHASESGTGIHLFASSLAPAEPSRFTAWKTAQAPWITRSLGLAGSVNSAMTQAGFSVTLGRIPLSGMESMTCPALAIEIGPQRDSDHKITAEPDNPDYQARVATALAAAVLEWRSDPTRTEGRQP